MNQRSRIWEGILIGFAACLLIGAALFLVIVLHFRAAIPDILRRLQEQPQQTVQETEMTVLETTADGETTGETIVVPAKDHLEALVTKIRELDLCIDRYFVLDYDYAAMNELALKAYVEAMDDPYSAYLTKDEYEKMMESSSGVYYGVGVQISQDTQTMETTITRIFRKSSGIQAGLKVYDILIAVDGVNVQQMGVSDIAAMVRGKDGTTVDLTVWRPSEEKEYTFTLERKQMETDTVEFKMLTADVGYILFSEFEEVSASQMKEAIDELRAQGMTRLVLDLRNNPGGLLSSLIEVSDLFLPKKELVIYMEDRQGKTSKYYTENAVYFDGELVILVNEYSASASEAFTGAMKDHGRAVILGMKTFGKGIVQSFFRLSDGDAVKLTTQHYCTPNGSNIHGVGITPDIVLEDDLNTPEVDELLERALEQLGAR